MKSGNLNFLEPSGPLQVCNGTALPFNYNIGMFFKWNTKEDKADRYITVCDSNDETVFQNCHSPRREKYFTTYRFKLYTI